MGELERYPEEFICGDELPEYWGPTLELIVGLLGAGAGTEGFEELRVGEALGDEVGEAAGFFSPLMNHDLCITSKALFGAVDGARLVAHAGLAAALAAASLFSVPNDLLFALVKDLALSL